MTLKTNAKFTLEDMITLRVAGETLAKEFRKDKQMRKSRSYKKLIQATRRAGNVIRTSKVVV